MAWSRHAGADARFGKSHWYDSSSRGLAGDETAAYKRRAPSHRPADPRSRRRERHGRGGSPTRRPRGHHHRAPRPNQIREGMTEVDAERRAIGSGLPMTPGSDPPRWQRGARRGWRDEGRARRPTNEVAELVVEEAEHHRTHATDQDSVTDRDTSHGGVRRPALRPLPTAGFVASSMPLDEEDAADRMARVGFAGRREPRRRRSLVSRREAIGGDSWRERAATRSSQ